MPKQLSEQEFFETQNHQSNNPKTKNLESSVLSDIMAGNPISNEGIGYVSELELAVIKTVQRSNIMNYIWSNGQPTGIGIVLALGVVIWYVNK